MSWSKWIVRHFNPRTPYGMRHYDHNFNIEINTFQSTHPLRDATCTFISIKSSGMYFNPRTPYGMRHKPMTYAYGNANISIHAPLTGCDFSESLICVLYILFQSTHPLRDATLYLLSVAIGDKFQSTHPLRDATIQLQDKQRLQRISIHAPLTGCDVAPLTFMWSCTTISIHAPLTGCDVCVRGYYKP